MAASSLMLKHGLRMKWRQLIRVLWDRQMSDRLKAKIYKTIVRPVALYSTECWPASVKHEQALHIMEMWMVWWSLWITPWEHVTNKDARKQLCTVPIKEKMCEARLRMVRTRRMEQQEFVGQEPPRMPSTRTTKDAQPSEERHEDRQRCPGGRPRPCQMEKASQKSGPCRRVGLILGRRCRVFSQNFIFQCFC